MSNFGKAFLQVARKGLKRRESFRMRTSHFTMFDPRSVSGFFRFALKSERISIPEIPHVASVAISVPAAKKRADGWKTPVGEELLA